MDITKSNLVVPWGQYIFPKDIVPTGSKSQDSVAYRTLSAVPLIPCGQADLVHTFKR